MTALREPLYRVEIVSSDPAMRGKAVVEKAATRETAERTAARINEQGSYIVASIKRTRWRLVLPR